MRMRTREGGNNPEVVRVRLLSRFRVSVGRRTIGEDAWRLRKAKSIVKLLALSPGHRLHRERVMDLLWPDSNRRSAYNNLRQAIHAARRAFDSATGFRYLATQDEQLVLCPSGDLWVDVEAFEETAVTARRSRDSAAYRAALELYSGELLPDDRYEEWAEDRSEQLRRLHLALLVELAMLYEERKEYEPAIEALRRVISEEPTLEEAHTALMRAYAITDRREQALAQYERFRDALARTLGTRPAAATRRLRDEIAAGRPQQRQPTRPQHQENSAGVGKHNLPASLTSFVGREGEMREIKRLFSMTRFLTLTGTGGSGKTRLALEVVRDFVGVYPDGVWVVELAGLSEGTLLPQAVAGALGVREQPGMSLTKTLEGALRTKNMLLLVDNCEHLLDATTRLTDTLLNSCPRLRILATSREPLGVAGEVNWLVSPLSMPDSARPFTAEELMRYEAVRLFVERARLRLPAFELTPHNAGAVAEVCRTLDGIPLAIELATARMGILAVEQVADKLEDSLKLLTGGARTSAQRHQTMRATLEWSYDLLDEGEQRLFARLSVFAGGWTLEAAEKVGAGDSIETGAVMDLLGRLVDKSLVITELSLEEGAIRYRMLELVRQFAREKLEVSADAEATLRRHADFFLDLAEEAEPNVRGPQQGEWLERLANEHENFRAALGWSLDREEKLGLRLTAALWWFWYARGHLSEGRQWLEGYLGQCSPEVSKARAKALNGVSWIAMFQGQFEDAQAYGREALALFRELEDDEGVAAALVQLGAAAVLGQLDDVPVPVLLEEATRLRPKIQDPSTIGNLSMLSGLFAAVRGEFDQSEALLGEALAQFRKIGDITGICHCLTAWGLATLSGRAYEKAYALFRENLRVAWESDHKVTIQSSLLGLGAVAASREQSVRAARLWGAVEALEEAYGIRMSLAGLYLAGYEGYLELARSRLEEVEFAEAWAEGKAMTTEEAVHYALSEDTVPTLGFESVGSSSGEQPSMLTRREREIASLLARELTTNRQISAELFISERTVETHVRNIFKKLGLDSRAQLAAWATERRSVDDVRS